MELSASSYRECAQLIISAHSHRSPPASRPGYHATTEGLPLYRTLGAFRRQVFLLFVSKGTAMVFLGLALGFAGGIGLGAILIFVIQKSYFGRSIKWT